MSGPYQRWDLSNYGAERLRVVNNCGNLCVKARETIKIVLSGKKKMYTQLFDVGSSDNSGYQANNRRLNGACISSN